MASSSFPKKLFKFQGAKPLAVLGLVVVNVSYIVS